MAVVNYTLFIVLFCAFRKSACEGKNFRILAPAIVCPKDENSVIEKPDNIVIALETEEEDLRFLWTVRWTHLEAPSQRFTLLLWRTVRALEVRLNAPQPEPFAYVINNTQLLSGVDYIFTITSSSESEENGTTRSFHIDNIKGDQKLLIDGQSDKLSVFLVGGSKIYTDTKYLLVAEVTSCSHVKDYYFAWRVEASGNIINVGDTSGWKLEIPPFSLRAGETYCVTCLVYRNSSLVTQTELPFEVLFRDLRVYLNVDHLVVSLNSGFTIKAVVENVDYYEETPMFEWTCTHDESCEGFQDSANGHLLIPTGFSHVGRYEINLLVKVEDQQASVKANITVVEPVLPVIHIMPLSRLVNEGSNISLEANASNVTPTCVLTWYFATEEYLASLDEDEIDKCEDCEHGEALSDSLTITSLEENFLNEITDFTNETEWRQVTSEIEAAEGRARFVVQCGCSLTFSCETEGVVYADISFHVNPGPIVADIKIAPEVGTAMETVFRINKLLASDPDKPILYTLLCSIGDEDTIELGSNLDHLAVDIFLPYIEIYPSDESGTQIWAVACDALGACTSSSVMSVQLTAGEARSLDLLVEDMRSYVLRCETSLLDYIVKAAIVTYKNTNQNEALATFSNSILETLPSEDHCLKKHPEYWTTLHWLANHGIDISPLE